jgi:hypothetical protein
MGVHIGFVQEIDGDVARRGWELGRAAGEADDFPIVEGDEVVDQRTPGDAEGSCDKGLLHMDLLQGQFTLQMGAEGECRISDAPLHAAMEQLGR